MLGIGTDFSALSSGKKSPQSVIPARKSIRSYAVWSGAVCRISDVTIPMMKKLGYKPDQAAGI